MVPRKTHGRCWISLSSPWELAGDVARAHHLQASLPGLRPQQTGSHPLLLSKKRFSPKKMLFPLICLSEEPDMLDLTKTFPAVYTDMGALAGPVRPWRFLWSGPAVMLLRGG